MENVGSMVSLFERFGEFVREAMQRANCKIHREQSDDEEKKNTRKDMMESQSQDETCSNAGEFLQVKISWIILWNNAPNNREERKQRKEKNREFQ
jgi:hypothetical protein